MLTLMPIYHISFKVLCFKIIISLKCLLVLVVRAVFFTYLRRIFKNIFSHAEQISQVSYSLHITEHFVIYCVQSVLSKGYVSNHQFSLGTYLDSWCKCTPFLAFTISLLFWPIGELLGLCLLLQISYIDETFLCKYIYIGCQDAPRFLDEVLVHTQLKLNNLDRLSLLLVDIVLFGLSLSDFSSRFLKRIY